MAGGRLIPGSQYGEDAVIVRLFGERQGGCALDIGAADGLHHSNVHRLITDYAWCALLVEPHPVLVGEARKRYAGNDRVHVVHSAIRAVPGDCILHLYEPSYYGQVSTTVEEFKQQVIEQHGDQFTKDVTVSCDTTRAIIERFMLTKIDFVNVDCEGSEIDALHTFPFDSQRPELFCIEMAMHVEQIDGIMRDQEYVQLKGLARYKNAFYVPMDQEDDCYKRLA